MNLDFTQKLGFKVKKINIRAQKIDGFTLKIFEIVIADFQIENKVDMPRLFQKIILVANTKFEVVLRMFFLKFSNTDILFNEEILIQKTYITNKALSIFKYVQIIDKKDFVIAVLDANSKMFIVYVAIWEQKKISIYSKRQNQIETQNKAQLGALLFDKTPTKILAKYFDYSNIFLAKNAIEFLENIKINKHTLKLKKNKQLSFAPIYSLGPVKLKTLKTYIKINLANDFIQSSKFSAGILILFDCKLDRSFCFCINY